MMQVDDVRMLVPHHLVPMRMAMRLRSFPAFVVMSMMLIVHMQVLVVHRMMDVL